MAKVAILGAGLMGTAMAWPLTDNGHRVNLIGTHLDDAVIAGCKEKRFHSRLGRALPESVEAYYFSEIGSALEGCEVIVSGVNSLGVSWMARQLGLHAKPGQSVIGITKGLVAAEAGKVRLFPQVLKDGLPESIRDQVEFAAIGGPCIAGELAGRRPTCVMFGAEKILVAERLAGIFATSYYFPRPTDDLVGLEVGVALKNAYTLAVGMAYGRLEREGGPDSAGASMHNLAAALFAEGCTEIRAILGLVGGGEGLAAGLPGAGDLYVTSMGGRTVRFGRLLGAGKSFKEARAIMAGETLECIEIVKCMGALIPTWKEQGRLRDGDLPLMETLVDIIVKDRQRSLPLGDFFRA